MPNAFNFSASPFDCLSTDEQALVRSNVDIAYFQPQAVVLEVGAETTHLFVIIKGYVTQMEGDEVQATFGPTIALIAAAWSRAAPAAALSRPRRCWCTNWPAPRCKS